MLRTICHPLLLVAASCFISHLLNLNDINWPYKIPGKCLVSLVPNTTSTYRRSKKTWWRNLPRVHRKAPRFLTICLNPFNASIKISIVPTWFLFQPVTIVRSSFLQSLIFCWQTKSLQSTFLLGHVCCFSSDLNFHLWWVNWLVNIQISCWNIVKKPGVFPNFFLSYMELSWRDTMGYIHFKSFQIISDHFNGIFPNINPPAIAAPPWCACRPVHGPFWSSSSSGSLASSAWEIQGNRPTTWRLTKIGGLHTWSIMDNIWIWSILMVNYMIS